MKWEHIAWRLKGRGKRIRHALIDSRSKALSLLRIVRCQAKALCVTYAPDTTAVTAAVTAVIHHLYRDDAAHGLGSAWHRSVLVVRTKARSLQRSPHRTVKKGIVRGGSRGLVRGW